MHRGRAESSRCNVNLRIAELRYEDQGRGAYPEAGSERPSRCPPSADRTDAGARGVPPPPAAIGAQLREFGRLDESGSQLHCVR
jgi:hypothetical protein